MGIGFVREMSRQWPARETRFSLSSTVVRGDADQARDLIGIEVAVQEIVDPEPI